MDKEAAEVAKLQAEVGKLNLETAALQFQQQVAAQRRPVDYAKWIVIVGGLATAMATGAGIFFQIRYELEFRITKELLTVVDNLQDLEKEGKASAAAYQLAAFGGEVVPFLARRVGTASPVVQDSIVAAFRYLVKEEDETEAVAAGLAAAATDALKREIAALETSGDKAEDVVLLRYISVINSVLAFPSFEAAYRDELDTVLEEFGCKIRAYGPFSSTEKENLIKALGGGSDDDCKDAKEP